MFSLRKVQCAWATFAFVRCAALAHASTALHFTVSICFFPSRDVFGKFRAATSPFVRPLSPLSHRVRHSCLPSTYSFLSRSIVLCVEGGRTPNWRARSCGHNLIFNEVSFDGRTSGRCAHDTERSHSAGGASCPEKCGWQPEPK